MEEERRREIEVDVVSFSFNLYRIIGLGFIFRDCGRGGKEEDEERR